MEVPTVPTAHQDTALRKGGSKWRYEVATLRVAHGIEDPPDALVRMHANRGITAEVKARYVAVYAAAVQASK